MTKKISLYVLLILAFTLSTGCVSFLPSQMVDSHKGMNCIDCHTAKPEKAVPNLKHPDNPSRICIKCHEYLKNEDHHASEIEPDSRTALPSHFKLYNGKMECLTCHRVHSGDNYQKGTANLLIGGSYNNRRTICFQCHNKESYSEINPHESMLNEDKSLNFTTCDLCHQKRPDPRVDRTADVEFKSEIHFLCWRCHPPMGGNFFEKHFLKKSAEEALALGTAAPDNTFDIMRVKERHLDLILPLDPKGKITCSTCHNPHQPGVMVDKKAAKGAGAENRLRFVDRCMDCHSN
jgi:hypothetical protein